MKVFDKEICSITVAFNVVIVVFALLILFRVYNRGALIEQIPKEEIKTTHISKVCIEGIWDECFEFPEGELVKIYFIKPTDSEHKILVVKPTR
jgi:hypothetical protein